LHHLLSGDEHAVALPEDLFLPVEGQVVAVFANEQLRQQSEEDMIAGVNSRAEQKGAGAAGMSVADYAKIKEDLCVGVVSSRISANDRALIEQCGTELGDALRAIGCGSGSPWGAPSPALK
jgi:hypothetical protein